MNLRKRLMPFVPPVIWSGLKRAAAPSDKTPASAQDSRDISAMVSDESFSVGFSRVTLSSGTFFVPDFAAHRPASRSVAGGTLYEPDTHAFVSRFLRIRRGNLVHAGTFFGDMLPTFSNACSGTVYAFEPVLESYVLAKLCVQENDLSNVILQNAGLGSTVSVARVDTGELRGVHRGGGSKIGDRGQFTAIVTIDSFAIDDLSIIHLDVEGYELEALRGATRTIEKSFPVIMIEDNNDECEGFLQSINYTHSGNIPDLSIWASADDDEIVRSVLERL